MRRKRRKSLKLIPGLGLRDALVMNLFPYVRIIAESDGRIDLEIKIRHKNTTKEARLPKSKIWIDRRNQEVQIPEYLCQKEGLQ